MSLEAVLERLRERISAEDAEKIDRVYELRFAGEARRWTLDLTGSGTLREGPPPEGACSVGLHEEDLADLLDRKTTLKVLFATGRLRVFGHIGDAMRLEPLFSRTLG